MAQLRAMSPERIALAVVQGSMIAQGRILKLAELDRLVRFLAGAAPPAQTPVLPSAACTDPITPFEDAFARPHWNGWGVGLSQHRFQPAPMAQLAAEDVPR